ncbi:MAG: GrpB family protein [Streptosporangiaceae bacterium]
MTGAADRPIAARVQVVPYDDCWPGRAAAELAGLRAALGPLVCHADHIGSTAVPGMAAKDILDLQLSVHDLDTAAAAFDAPLARLGYTRLGYERDHVPAGDGSDPALWAKRYWRRRDHPAGDVNLHVRVAGSPNERLALLFRDWLRAHPLAVAAYARFKAELARAVAGLDVYTEVRDPVVDLVVVAAARWARDTAWQPHATGNRGVTQATQPPVRHADSAPAEPAAAHSVKPYAT